MRMQSLTPQERRKFYDEAKDIVMVDFDGTLCRWSYPDMGEPEPGARHFMKSLITRGLRPIVWSCRTSPEFNTEDEVADVITRIGRWCQKWNIPYHAIDCGQSGKRLCLAYVDDRNAQYTGQWAPVLRRIDRLQAEEQAKRGSAA